MNMAQHDAMNLIVTDDINPLTYQECERALCFFYDRLQDQFYTREELKEFIADVSRKYIRTL